MLINKTARITGLPLDKAEVSFAATPRTLERYTGNINGSIVGAEMTVGQSGRGRFNYQSEIGNLFLAGHDTIPAGSVGSAIDSGVISGRLIRICR
jgi:phytoene dehydrogenase-like protein